MDCSPPGSSVHEDSPGKNTGVGSHSLLQGIFLTQGLNPGLLHCRQILYQLNHQGEAHWGHTCYFHKRRSLFLWLVEPLFCIRFGHHVLHWALFGLHPYIESLWIQYDIVMHLSFIELKNWNFHLHFWHDWSGVAPVRYSVSSLFWVILHTLLYFHPSRMTCIEYISELPRSLASICVQDISKKEEGRVRDYSTSSLPTRSPWPICVSSEGHVPLLSQGGFFPRILKSYTTMVPLLLSSHTFVSSLSVNKDLLYPFSSGSSRPRNWTTASCIAGGFFTNWAISCALKVC